MIYGMYLSAQGAEAQSMRQATIANNMANAGTTAFKPDIPVFRAHAPFDAAHGRPSNAPDTWDEQTGGLTLEGTVTDFSQGPLKSTGRAFDLAFKGDGFFQVTDGKKNYLTRDGQFTLNADGALVLTSNGYAVLDADDRPIVPGNDTTSFEVSDDGSVYTSRPGTPRILLAQLARVEALQPSSLMKAGDGLYETALGTREMEEPGQIRQGFLEQSGMDPLQGTVDLIETSRGFESNINMIRMQDEMLSRLLSSLPRK